MSSFTPFGFAGSQINYFLVLFKQVLLIILLMFFLFYFIYQYTF